MVMNKVFIRKKVTNKRGHYSLLKLIFVSTETVISKLRLAHSLGGITRPGSLGMISAFFQKHPFEMGQR